jgi:Tol biopolymer transport system component
MGTVFRALDTNLNRPVAIKFLSGELADVAGRRRFQREAQMASSLNHPHILTVYDAGEFEGRQYLVTEYVDGGTLKDWWRATNPAWRQIVDLLTGVADGLAAAHDAGILHRDIKPANILVSKNGYARLGDFGLAKLKRNSDSDATRTLTEGRTGRGVLVGTIPYMSPEQASGKTVDSRSDIFSFGVVLHELLAGARPFTGSTELEVLQNIIHGSPAALPEGVPSELRNLVEKTLENDPAERYQSMREIVIDLRRLGRHRDVQGPVVTAPPRRAWIPWTAGAAAAIVLGIGLWVLLNRSAAGLANPLAEAVFTRLTDFEGAETNPAISPDGNFVAFVSDRAGQFNVWLGQTNAGIPSNLTQGRLGDLRGPLRAIGFSGDGSEIWVAGVEGRRLRLLPLVGGAPRNYLGEHAAEVAWSQDGNRVVYHVWDPGDATFVADRNGANERQILRNEPGLHNHYQVWSKDGRWIYFVRGRPATREMDLWRISPDGGEPEQLTHLNTDVAFPTPLDQRTILFVAHDETGAGPWMWALDVDTRTSRRISSGLEQYTAIGASADGRRLVASQVSAQVSLWSIPITSGILQEDSIQAFPLTTVRAQMPRYGGQTLFYLSSRDGRDGLWSHRDGVGQEIVSGSEGLLQAPPAVSLNGERVAFALRRGDKWQLHVISADGTGLRPLSAEVDIRGTASWSPDEKWIVAAGRDQAGEGLFKLPLDGGPPERLATGPFLDPVWSPRGDLIVYGGTQVFTLMPLLAVRPDGTAVDLPEINVRREGERARFLPDGSGLVYMLGETIEGHDFWLLDLAAMRSRRLTRLDSSATMRTFDITPDGRSIIFDRSRQNSDVLLIELSRSE